MTSLDPSIPRFAYACTNAHNHNRRKQSDGRLDKQPLGRAVFRATSAHANSFEALICFSAACFCAHLAKLDEQVCVGMWVGVYACMCGVDLKKAPSPIV